jgi:hypothetical protein
MNDILKRQIKVGDIVAYATRCGNSGSLHLGYVYEMGSKNESIKIYVLGGGFISVNPDKFKKTELFYEDRIIVIAEHKTTEDLTEYIIK